MFSNLEYNNKHTTDIYIFNSKTALNMQCIQAVLNKQNIQVHFIKMS